MSKSSGRFLKSFSVHAFGEDYDVTVTGSVNASSWTENHGDGGRGEDMSETEIEPDSADTWEIEPQPVSDSDIAEVVRLVCKKLEDYQPDWHECTFPEADERED